MNIKKLLIIISLFFISNYIYSQKDTGYKISVKYNGQVADTCYLGYYHGRFQYSKDTAYFDKKGLAVFENNDESLNRGVYFIILPNKRHFDIIIVQEQVFSIEIDTSDIIGSMKIKGSVENERFVNYNKSMVVLSQKMTELKELEQKYSENEHDSIVIIKDEISATLKQMTELKENFVEKYPESFTTKIFLITKDPEIPESPILEDGEINSSFSYYYYKNNYFKHIDLTDDAIVRTPVFHSRLEKFFTSVIAQYPDTIIYEIDKLTSKVEDVPELFKYIVWFLTYHYETSQIMGFDAVFVYMAETYYKTDRAFWASETVKSKIIEKAEKTKPLLLGKVAPNMALMDTSLQNYIPLHNIRANYLIMLFWEPDCGHCKKEIERLNNFYTENKEKYGLMVYSVCTDTNLTKWKKLIDEKDIANWINVNATRSALGHYQELYDMFSTPTIYLLDKSKKIIAKRLGAEGVVNFIPKHYANKKERE